MLIFSLKPIDLGTKFFLLMLNWFRIMNQMTSGNSGMTKLKWKKSGVKGEGSVMVAILTVGHVAFLSIYAWKFASFLDLE